MVCEQLCSLWAASYRNRTLSLLSLVGRAEETAGAVCFGRSSSGHFSCWGIDMQSGTQVNLVSSGNKVMVETLSPTHAQPRILTQPGTRSTWHIFCGSQGVQSGSGKSRIQNINGAWGELISNCLKPAWRCSVPSPAPQIKNLFPLLILLCHLEFRCSLEGIQWQDVSFSDTSCVYHWGFPKSKLGIFASPPVGSVPFLTEMFYHLLPQQTWWETFRKRLW